MKCTVCDGRGYFPVSNIAAKVCPQCNGTGEVEQTNEEWRKNCSAEVFAYWLADVCAWAMEEFRCGNTEKANIAYWDKWLKEKHDGQRMIKGGE